jgi:hypothetical protein
LAEFVSAPGVVVAGVAAGGLLAEGLGFGGGVRGSGHPAGLDAVDVRLGESATLLAGADVVAGANGRGDGFRDVDVAAGVRPVGHDAAGCGACEPARSNARVSASPPNCVSPELSSCMNCAIARDLARPRGTLAGLAGHLVVILL